MKFNKRIFLTLALVFFLSATVVFAASSGDYLVKAQKYVDDNCAKGKISNQISLNCYLFYKLGEIEALVNSNNTRLDNAESDINELQNANQTEDVVFFPFGWIQDDQESPVIDVGNHKLLILRVTRGNGTGVFRIYYSDDQINWTEHDYSMPARADVPYNIPQQWTYPTKGQYYKIVMEGTVSGDATAVLY